MCCVLVVFWTALTGVSAREYWMDAESLFLKGKEAADRGNYDYAIAMLLDVVIEFPEHIESRLALRACEEQVFRARGGGSAAKTTAVLKGLGPLITMLIASGNPKKTVVACERFLVNWPSCIFALLKLSQALRRMEHVKAAISTLEYATHRQPQNTRVLWALGAVYEETEDFIKATRCFENILRFDATDDDAKHKLKDLQSMSHMQKTHLEDGVDSMQTVKDMDLQKQLMDQERVVKTADQLEDEVASLQSSLREDATASRKWLRLGEVYAQQDKLKLALQAYEKSYELEPRYPTRERIGDVHLRVYRDAEVKAKSDWDAAPEDQALKARYEQIRGKRDEHAVEEFAFRVAEHPTDVGFSEQLGDAYTRRAAPGDVEQALLQYQKAINDPRRRSRCLRKLGACFALSEATYDMALMTLEQARQATHHVPHQMEIDYEIGQLCEKLDRVADAQEAYKRVYQVDAAFRDVAHKVLDLSKAQSRK